MSFEAFDPAGLEGWKAHCLTGDIVGLKADTIEDPDSLSGGGEPFWPVALRHKVDSRIRGVKSLQWRCSGAAVALQWTSWLHSHILTHARALSRRQS